MKAALPTRPAPLTRTGWNRPSWKNRQALGRSFSCTAPVSHALPGAPFRAANSWQIGFLGDIPRKGKVRIAAYILVIWMLGPGGLEPPPSPLSSAFMVLYASYYLH